ncbi:MAG: YfiR family protein [Motiliproteus sp.]|nr:YfiR family protein [Motiliproteus sp.]MCW9053009.1 YfiR family protein [Motiliproteus sp.]
MNFFPRRSITNLLPLVVIASVCLTPSAIAATADDKLKAAILVKLSKFVTWPENYNRDLNLCIFRSDAIFKILQRHANLTSNKRPIKITPVERVSSELDQCSILYIPAKDAYQIRQVIMGTAYSPALTISDYAGFADVGGMIELSKSGNRIRFRINLDSVLSSKIRIASPLLEISDVVERN